MGVEWTRSRMKVIPFSCKLSRLVIVNLRSSKLVKTKFWTLALRETQETLRAIIKYKLMELYAALVSSV